MSIRQWIEQQKAEHIFIDCVVYANIGNDTDELVVCTIEEADNADCVIVSIDYIEHNTFARTAVIIAEVA